MYILIFIIIGLIRIFLIKEKNKYEDLNMTATSEELGDLSMFLAFIQVCFLVFFMLPCIYRIATYGTIDEKIAMYEQQNVKIEQQVADTVRMYMKYEEENNDEISDEQAILLAEVHPKLMNNESIVELVTQWKNNKTKISQLEYNKARISDDRFFLYFGITL